MESKKTKSLEQGLWDAADALQGNQEASEYRHTVLGLIEYSPSDRDQAGVPIDEMVAVMLEKHEIIRGLLRGCDYSSPDLPAGQHSVGHAVMADPGCKRFPDQVFALTKAHGLSCSRDEAARIHNNAQLFVDACDSDCGGSGSGAVEIDTVIGQLVNEAVAVEEVVDIYKLARQMRAQAKRHEQLGLTESEAAFYDAIVQNDAAVLQMGDATLRKMAAELVVSIRQGATIDWNLKESVRAATRTKVRRLLAKCDYPPYLEEQAVELVLEQAELFASGSAS